MSDIRTLLVIAKQPVPGRVKTRLIGACTPAEAAGLAAAALADTLHALRDFPSSDKVILLEGDPAGLVPPGWQVLEQGTGGLDRRLAAGFAAVPDGPAVLVGMDTPQLSTELLCFDPGRYDACLGPAADGGYWTIGFRDPGRAGECIPGVPMSTAATGAEQHRRLLASGMAVQSLAMLTDVDTESSASEVALAAPRTRFASQWREIRGQ
ncbi:MAG: DUF2064 domain-containing protein [Jatrophihabitantaceae bacterium]